MFEGTNIMKEQKCATRNSFRRRMQLECWFYREKGVIQGLGIISFPYSVMRHRGRD